MVKLTYKGDYHRTRKFLRRNSHMQIRQLIRQYAYEGLERLRDATPKDTGITASMWEYEVNYTNSGAEVVYKNNSNSNGIPIVILLQYGHGTRNGAYVQGRDFINPAIQPLFDKIADVIWTEVTKE